MPISQSFDTLCGITERILDLGAIVQLVEEAMAGGAGAVVPFIGVVRNHSQGGCVRVLEYEAYMPMAVREMQAISDETTERWGTPCAIWHRLGALEVGQVSVIVAVAAAHRAEAFEAARFAIEAVKARVPIWKKELGADGSWWVDDPTGGVMQCSTVK
jgi:molybdopterin synthase catalytic subunit